jgi:hypothetical protein
MNFKDYFVALKDLHPIPIVLGDAATDVAAGCAEERILRVWDELAFG